MKKFERGDRVRGTDSNADVLEATVTKKPWEEIEIEWVEILVVNSTRPESIGKTFSVCTSYIEEIKPGESIQKVKKFKVGDHIKGISENGTTETNAEVIFVEPDYYDGDLDIQIAGKDCVLWVNSKKFQLVDSDQAIVSSFVINGQEYANEQYIKDCERYVRGFPEKDLFDFIHAMENILIVYQWAQQNPVVTNLDHYAEEFGWTEEQKKYVLESVCPFPFRGNLYDFCPKQSSGNYIPCRECRDWWNQEWKGGKA